MTVDAPPEASPVGKFFTRDDGEVVQAPSRTIRRHPLSYEPRGPRTCIETGRVITARSQAEVDAVIERWRSLGPQPIAHDVECAASPTVANGSGLHPHLGTVRLAQFGVRDGGNGYPEALVIDCWKQNPGQLLDMLADPEWPTIIHYAQMETRWIGYRYGRRIENLTDTCLSAKLAYKRHGFTGEPLQEDLERIGRDAEREEGAIEEGKAKLPAQRGPRFALGAVSERELDVELDKTQQVSYWDAVKLTREQEKYAGEDVLCLLDLHQRFEPLLEEEDHEKLREAASLLNDKSVGVSAAEAAERNRETLQEMGYDPDDADFDINTLPRAVRTQLSKPSAVDVKNCESPRALRMIAACRSKTELNKVANSFGYMRLHFSNVDLVQSELRAREQQLQSGASSPRARKIKVAGWSQPF